MDGRRIGSFVRSTGMRDGTKDEVAMIVTTTTQPGRRADVFGLYEELLAPRAGENPDQRVVVWCDDQQDENTFHLFEIYASAEAMGANASAPWFGEYLRKAGPMLAGEPRVAMATPRWSTGL